MYFTLSFVENKLTYNQNLVCLWNPNSDILASVYIANKDLSLNLINIGSDTFLTRYKITYSTTEDPKVLDILSILVHAFSRINICLEYFVKSLVRKSFKVFISSVLKLNKKPQQISNIFFIIANIF